MSEPLSIVTTVLPIIGVAVGASLQFVFSRSSEGRKQQQTLRNQAYVDYLRAVAAVAHAASEDASRAALGAAADAKARIAVYGAPLVLRALADFELNGPELIDPEKRDRFIALSAAMRERPGDVDANHLRLILMGPTPEERRQHFLAATANKLLEKKAREGG